MTVIRKKLIEVALPLEAINIASAREKSIRHGHPSTLHLWWARRPLAAARAVIFSQMVDNPSAVPELFATEEEQDHERQRLFALITELVKWENTADERLLEQARGEISRSWRRACEDNKHDPRAAELFDAERLPEFHDPFAGGGSLPLEAQRLGLEACASDLNPVAVLICKAMIEIPPKFAGQPPVNPESRQGRGSTTAGWKGTAGLAEDVRYYGNWLRHEAEKRIGHLYPKVRITPEMVAERPDLSAYLGRELTVVAWIWARTVKSPNPAYAQVDVPLASTFILSKMSGNEAYIQPVIESGSYRFTVKVGKSKQAEAAQSGTSAGKRAAFRCVMSGAPLSYDYIRSEGQAGRMGARLMAIVAEGDRGRVYVAPTTEMEDIATTAQPTWRPETPLHGKCRVNVSNYGLDVYGDLFTARQTVALTTFAGLVAEIPGKVRDDALAAGLGPDTRGLSTGGVGARAYGEALAVYLAVVLDRLADYNSALCTWHVGGPTTGTKSRNTFSRQALPMTWDLAEVNPLSNQSGSLNNSIDYAAKSIFALGSGSHSGRAWQADAASMEPTVQSVISTDPPYYDNIGYADLSDFFYVWLRPALKDIFPDLFSTLAAPKAEELVATPYRHGSKEKAEAFFLDGMTQAMSRLAINSHPAFPVTIYYAFKQAESEAAGGTSTGWETFLEAVLRSGLSLVGTWPMRTELTNRMISSGANALASSIVLVCRPRATDAPTATRMEFLQELSVAMREALPVLASGDVAPVDLAQASIGPGLGAYSRYSAVVRQDGKPVTVRDALMDINNAISAYRTERTSTFDQKTRFCLDFYDQFGFAKAAYGEADNLARAKDVGVNVLEADQLLVAEAGKAWLVALTSYPVGIAGLERRFGNSAWEACMRLAATLQEEGESGTAALARDLGEGVCARARELAVWLYTIADARRRAQDALAFNALDASWPEIQRLITSMDRGGEQGRFA